MTTTVPPMVTLPQVKDWLGGFADINASSPQDGKLTVMINGVSAKIAQYCDTDFALHVLDPGNPEIIDGVRADIIIPRYLPLLSVESLLIHIDVTGLGGLDLDTDDYQIEQWGLVLKRLNTPQGRANVSIGYHGGYTAVPDDVVQAALLSVEAFYLRKTRGTIGISSRTKAVGSGTSEMEAYMNAWDLDAGLPKEAVAMLQSHKNFEWPSNQSMATRNY